MDIAMAASRSLSSEISVAAGKPILRGIHHLALVTDNMRMTLEADPARNPSPRAGHR